MLRRFSTRLTILPESWSASAPVAIASLILANILPLLGVLYLEWSLYSILLLFWLESGVIGLFNILKMLTAQGDANRPAKIGDFEIAPDSPIYRIYRIISRLWFVVFFCVHYGIFWAAHGIFVETFFNDAGPFAMLANPLFTGSTGDSSRINGSGEFGAGLEGGVLNVAGFMMVSHGISFVSNYLGHGEYRHATSSGLMSGSYGRVIVLHIVILVGGALVLAMDAPVYAVALLVLLKIGVDLRAHLREHRQYADA
jgi:hypothetical protein